MANTSESKIRTRVDKLNEKKVICSDFNIGDFADDKDLDEDKLDDLIAELLKDKKIYKFGDMKSYLENVRIPGHISFTEKHMMKNIKANKNKAIYRDLEFPIDADGKYDLDNIDKKEFYVVNEMKFYKS
ncbi:MAG: hypothetical protein Faunusvirus55_1 [Faunusvirus sp.]|jgi:hypothetical protein|uniref:Uncharacterized protein n=1 Tax=Faunusvirus sp. TaxID=2487766 RepID=A0A3G5A1R9_9VIRU|nr:MAG: hypothetical protein Faunusvirus55_1 [Faunusvirus sp.]